jgi:hypothetical protein
MAGISGPNPLLQVAQQVWDEQLSAADCTVLISDSRCGD